MPTTTDLGPWSGAAFAAAPGLAAPLLLVVVILIRPLRGAVTERAR